jgi:hypothetical protein
MSTLALGRCVAEGTAALPALNVHNLRGPAVRREAGR